MSDDSKSRVLVVDDVSRNIQIVGNILKKAGYIINFANSGAKALEHAGKRQYDLILLDIMMPQMDGFEVCEKLKADDATAGIPVIFLTAKTDADSITKAFEAGGVDYITKPFNSAELLARVNTHVKLKNREEELKELNATKDKLFSIIAHDLKNPFNTLLGNSELLLKKYHSFSSEKVESMLSTIYSSSRKNYTLLENLLMWSRSQTNRIDYNPAPVDLSTLMQDGIFLLKDTAEAKSITIHNTVDANLKVYADFDMITLVLRNLMSNAIKFTPEKGDIYLQAGPQDEKTVNVCIADTGVGIEKDKLSTLFTISDTFSTSGTNQEKGTGLGLILCKEFVHKHGGEIWAESEMEKGSRFCFTLERVDETPNDEDVKISRDLHEQLVQNKDFSEVKSRLKAAGKEAAGTMNINNIHEFADFAIKYGEDYRLDSLLTYGNALKESVSSFDIQRIKDLLQLFNDQV